MAVSINTNGGDAVPIWRNVLLLVILAGVGLAAGMGVRYWFEQHRSTTESPASLIYRPDFTLMDLHNAQRSASEWDGQILVVNFWATWCPPCRREIPSFIELQRTQGNRGLQVIGIAIDDSEKVKDFAQEYGINYPTLLGEQAALQLSQMFGNTAGVLPFTAIIDRSGRVVHRHKGELNEAKLRTLIQPLL